MVQMQSSQQDKVLVVNFNAPELNQLARALAAQGLLERMVRPYVNKGRLWEKALSNLPLGGRVYDRTVGRRQLGDPALAALTREAGVVSDWCSALAGRSHWLPNDWRHGWTNRLHMSVRESVAKVGGQLMAQSGARVRHVVAYEGFALPAFESAQRSGAKRWLNYPVAHHRQRRLIRDEELALQPSFASTWPGFDDWGPGHEERLDREIDTADQVLLGSPFAADSFVAQGINRDKLCVVPYGVDLQTFSPPAQPPARGTFKVIYSGQLTQRKGLSYLLQGYQRFARADTELTLVGGQVGGPEPLRPYAHLFKHVPHQPRPALAERYRQSHVFVFPTLVEGMPLVVLEAMASGLPVIVTANGPAGIVRDGIDGFIIEQRSPEAVHEKLDLLYRDRDRCAAMGRNAARRAQQFSWQAYADGVTGHMLGSAP
jgi:glycosyltransferase involved in cell wall biosynthesis